MHLYSKCFRVIIQRHGEREREGERERGDREAGRESEIERGSGGREGEREVGRERHHKQLFSLANMFQVEIPCFFIFAMYVIIDQLASCRPVTNNCLLRKKSYRGLVNREWHL